MEIKIKTLTPLWTGDVNRECKTLKETGIIGSLRWWYEALIRGLGGYACDPTSDKVLFKKCELNQEKFNKAIKSGKPIQEALDEQICPACQLFGCTGWGRKIRMEIIPNGIFRDGFEGELILKIEELKKLSEEEKWLFKKTSDIVSNYGSIGGRITRKPQRHPVIGKDYGLISVNEITLQANTTKNDVEKWLIGNKEELHKNNNEEWPNIRSFFFVRDYYLSREQMNMLMKVIPYLAGKKRTREDMGRSKRIFSFKAAGGRIWGYVKDEKMLKMVEDNLNQIGISQIIRGMDVLK